MSDDLTNKTPDRDGDLFTLILTIVRKLDKHETILTQISDRLGKLESRVDAVETRLALVEKRLDAIEERLESFQSVLNDSILKIHVGLIDMDERLRSLEPQRKPTNSST